MASINELLISTADAEALVPVIGNRSRVNRFEAEATDALADILVQAPLVSQGRLPADRVAMNSRVTYREEPSGARRTVVIVPPAGANLAEGRISVLSPVGRSLLGRRSGSAVLIAVPGGRALTIRILGIERAPDCSLKAA